MYVHVVLSNNDILLTPISISRLYNNRKKENGMISTQPPQRLGLEVTDILPLYTTEKSGAED